MNKNLDTTVGRSRLPSHHMSMIIMWIKITRIALKTTIILEREPNKKWKCSWTDRERLGLPVKLWHCHYLVVEIVTKKLFIN